MVTIPGSPALSPIITEQALAVTRLEPKTVQESNQKAIEAVFGVNNIMLDVARCESNLTHYQGDVVLIGKVNSNDIGLFQINKMYHLEKSKELGLDIYILEDNITYAKWLYDREGTKPWSASKFCWKG
jgi:hypothetical protein